MILYFNETCFQRRETIFFLSYLKRRKSNDANTMVNFMLKKLIGFLFFMWTIGLEYQNIFEINKKMEFMVENTWKRKKSLHISNNLRENKKRKPFHLAKCVLCYLDTIKCNKNSFFSALTLSPTHSCYV